MMENLYKYRDCLMDSPTFKALQTWKFTALLLVIISMQANNTLAQSAKRKINGQVTSVVDGQAVPGVSILIKGTNSGTATDIEGNFTMEAADTDVLIVSYIGYHSQEVAVGTKSRIDISLVEDIAKLREVVVVGYGEMKKTDLSSSQVTIGVKEIQQTVNTTLEQAIQGRAANVFVSQNSGQPGAPFSVMVRGISSINGSTDPLYVIDGVQILPDSRNGTNANALSGINPDDIETMNILQGPSATSVYGSRAANGVVVITTKKGKAGETRITYSNLFTMQDVPTLIPTMTLREYAIYRNEYARVNNFAADPVFMDPSLLGDGTNWQKELFRKTLLQKQQLSLSGGNEKTTFYLSGEYFNQQGVARGSGFTRYNFTLNLENHTRKWLKLGTNLKLNQTKEVVNISNSDILNIAISQSPNIPLKNPDGTWGGPADTQFQMTNPVALAAVNDNRNRRVRADGTLYAEINPLKGLVWRNEVTTSAEFRNEYRFSPSYKFGGYENLVTNASRNASNYMGWQFNSLLRYNLTIGKHEISAMVSHEAQASTSENLSGSRNNFVSNNIQELSGGDATTANANSGKSQWSMESYFGRFHYVLNEKYILQATYRTDGSPNFGPENRWAVFPAVSAAWRISKEAFMSGITPISELKLRAEYGITGNQNSNGYYALLSAVPTLWGTGFISNNFSNPFLKWEETKTYNLGMDLRLFQGRIEVIADAYVKKTENLLTQNELPFYSGGNAGYSPGYIQFPTANIGALQNKGFGITINSTNLEGPFSWRTGLTFSMDRNKITALYQDVPIRREYNSSGFLAVAQVGLPVWQYYGYEAEGLFQSIEEISGHAVQTANKVLTIDPRQGTWVGDVKYKDQLTVDTDGDGVLDKGDGIIDEKDRTLIGNPWPKFVFGFTNTFSYKNVELTAFITGIQGNDVYNYARSRNENVNGTGPGSGLLKSVADFAQVSSDIASENPHLLNPNTWIPRLSAGNANGNNRASNRYIEDGSYVRIKNVQLAYRLPKVLASKVHLGGVRLAVNVQNLYTFTKYKGYDPELNISGPSIGIDNARYPSTRMYTFSMQVDF